MDKRNFHIPTIIAECMDDDLNKIYQLIDNHQDNFLEVIKRVNEYEKEIKPFSLNDFKGNANSARKLSSLSPVEIKICLEFLFNKKFNRKILLDSSQKRMLEQSFIDLLGIATKEPDNFLEIILIAVRIVRNLPHPL